MFVLNKCKQDKPFSNVLMFFFSCLGTQWCHFYLITIIEQKKTGNDEKHLLVCLDTTNLNIQTHIWDYN